MDINYLQIKCNFFRAFRSVFPKHKYGDLSSKYYPEKLKNLNDFYSKAKYIPEKICENHFTRLRTQEKESDPSKKTKKRWVYNPRTKDGYIWEAGLLTDIEGHALTVLFPRVSYSEFVSQRIPERSIEIFSQPGTNTKKAKNILNNLIHELNEKWLILIAEELHKHGNKTKAPKADIVKCDICGKNNEEMYEPYFILNHYGNHKFMAHETCTKKLISKRIKK